MKGKVSHFAIAPPLGPAPMIAAVETWNVSSDIMYDWRDGIRKHFV